LALLRLPLGYSVTPFEKAKLSGIYTAVGRPLGAKNKRTLLREANIREAAARAQFDLAMTDDESIKADSLAVMEDAMAYFYRLALKERHRNEDADFAAIRDNLREAVTYCEGGRAVSPREALYCEGWHR